MASSTTGRLFPRPSCGGPILRFQLTTTPSLCSRLMCIRSTTTAKELSPDFQSQPESTTSTTTAQEWIFQGTRTFQFPRPTWLSTLTLILWVATTTARRQDFFTLRTTTYLLARSSGPGDAAILARPGIGTSPMRTAHTSS